jgi:hypothetical protein
MSFNPYNPKNNVLGLRLASAYSSGSGTMSLTAGGSSFPAPPTRITVVTAATYGQGPSEVLTIFAVTAVAGDVLTIGGPIEGTTDRNFAAGDYVDIRMTAGYISDLNTALNGILNPYQAPGFTAFAITGQSTTLEVGASISSGAKTFTWSTSNGGNVQANSISIVDTTLSATLASGLANDGTESLSISAITDSAPQTHVWTVSGTNTESGGFSRTFTVSWLWKAYAGTSASATLDASGIQALADFASLTSTPLRTYSLSVGGYKYVAFPDSFATPSLWKDPATGFNVPLATVIDNAAYSHTDSAGNQYAIVSVTNANSVTTNFRVYRSQNTLGGSLSLQVS